MAGSPGEIASVAMPVNRTLWKSAFVGKIAPLWPCPRCNGVLVVVKGTFHEGESADSRASRDEQFDPYLFEAAFSTLLECNKCREVVACSGHGVIEPSETYDADGNYTVELQPLFFPHIFSIPMRLLTLPARTPKTVKDSLVRSFFLVFADAGAAATYLRHATEQLLTERGVVKADNKGKPIPIGRRIQAFTETNIENGERLSALRWIGHSGAHPETTTKDDVFDGYDILEVVLEDLYVGHQRTVRRTVEQINTTKGPKKNRLIP